MKSLLIGLLIAELIIDIWWTIKYYKLVEVHKEVLHANQILTEKLGLKEND